MDLKGTCVSFIMSTEREDVAETSRLLLEAARSCIQNEVPLDATSHVLRAIVACRSKSIGVCLDGLREWSASDPLGLIECGQWDPLCLLLFLCECHLRICISHLFNENGGWDASVTSGPGLAPSLDDALTNDEMVVVGEELARGLDHEHVGDLLTRRPVPRAATAVAICFEQGDEGNRMDEGVSPVDPEGALSVDPLVDNTRLSRKGVRLLERAMLTDSINIAIEFEISGYEEDHMLESPFYMAETVQVWMKKTVEVDANNALLLRLDEWAMCCALDPGDVSFATSERGTVPQEHRNTPAAWVAQVAKPDAQYKHLMAATKRNGEHAENAYVCFSGMLEQHFGFDWATRCLSPRLAPSMTLRKIREYKASARAKTPPLVVQRAEGRATVISTHGRVECQGPGQALSAWLACVGFHHAGEFTRKANVRDIVTRMQSQLDFSPDEIPTSIGGERITVSSI